MAFSPPRVTRRPSLRDTVAEMLGQTRSDDDAMSTVTDLTESELGGTSSASEASETSQGPSTGDFSPRPVHHARPQGPRPAHATPPRPPAKPAVAAARRPSLERAGSGGILREGRGESETLPGSPPALALMSASATTSLRDVAPLPESQAGRETGEAEAPPLGWAEAPRGGEAEASSAVLSVDFGATGPSVDLTRSSSALLAEALELDVPELDAELDAEAGDSGPVRGSAGTSGATTPEPDTPTMPEPELPPAPPDEAADRYGFYVSDAIHRAREITPKEKKRRSRKEEERTKKWLAMLDAWDRNERSGKLKTRIRKGIPDSVRGLVWCRIIEVPSYRASHPDLYANLVVRQSEAGMEESEIYQTIERDICRTFPKHVMFGRHNPAGQNLLRRVLHAYSLFDEELGYCQGMGFIAAMFLSYMTEEDAFYLLMRVVNRPGSHLRGLYLKRMPMMLVVLKVFEGFIAQVLPRLSRKLIREGIDPTMFATEWFVTVFTASFPFDLVTRVWDVFLFEGWKIVYRVALALLQQEESALLQMDFEQILNHLKRTMPQNVDGEAVMRTALRVPITQRQVSRRLVAAATEMDLANTNFGVDTNAFASRDSLGAVVEEEAADLEAADTSLDHAGAALGKAHQRGGMAAAGDVKEAPTDDA